MSQQINITTPLSPANVTAIKAAIAAVNVLVAPIDIALTETQKKGLVSVSTNRASELEAIETGLMEAFPQTITAPATLVEFLALKQEQIDSNTLHGMAIALANTFSLHSDIAGNNMMLMGIGVMDAANILGKTNPAIKTARQTIVTNHLTHSTPKSITTFSIAPSATVEVTGLKKGKKIINNGTTILTALVKGGSAADTITINPGDSKDAPTGWVNVTVTNLSATTAGSFQVYKS